MADGKEDEIIVLTAINIFLSVVQIVDVPHSAQTSIITMVSGRKVINYKQ